MRNLLRSTMGIAASACLMLGCGADTEHELGAGEFDSKYIEYVGEGCGVTLPSGSLGQHLWEGKGLEPPLAAKIEIQAKSVQGFVDKVKKLPASTTARKVPKPNTLSWWHPVLEGASVDHHSRQGEFSVHIILCREGDKWFVYVEWAI